MLYTVCPFLVVTCLSEFEIFIVYKEDGGLFPDQIHVGHIFIFDLHLTVDRNNLYILLDTEENENKLL